MQFILFLDEVGAEYAKAKITIGGIFPARWSRFKAFRPLGIRPLEVHDEKGAAKRAATGYLLLGAGGAAAGVLMGKGQSVVFELDCHDGVSRRGAVRQKYYPAMRRAVERIQRARPRDGRRQLGRWAVYLGLAIALAIGMGEGELVVGLFVGLLSEIIYDRRKLARTV